MCLSGFEPARFHGFTSEVSHAYGIFHYFKKKSNNPASVLLNVTGRSNACLRHLLILLRAIRQYADLTALPKLSYNGISKGRTRTGDTMYRIFTAP